MIYLPFILSIFSLSLSITYAMWIKVRVWCLRQQLFELRDEFWFKCESDGSLHSQDRRVMRDVLNQMIVQAPRISAASINELLRTQPAKFRNDLNEDALTQEYTMKTIFIVKRYVYFYTLSGFVTFLSLVWQLAEETMTKSYRDESTEGLRLADVAKLFHGIPAT